MLNNSSGTYYLICFVLGVTVKLLFFYHLYFSMREFLGCDLNVKKQLTNSVEKYTVYF